MTCNHTPLVSLGLCRPRKVAYGPCNSPLALSLETGENRSSVSGMYRSVMLVLVECIGV